GGKKERSGAGQATPAEPERKTLDLVAGGALGALARIYESYARPAYLLAFRITGSIPDAQDVVQDLFIALPEALASFRGDGSFSSWFRSCAARQALLHLRARRRRHEVDLLPDRKAGKDDQPLARIELEEALHRLPERLRMVVILRDIEGFSHEDVARMLDITPAASRMRLMRARRQLRNMVGPLTGETD
ncbi:MAG: sigma-70 family RNA polymerase sigma factor, partial [Gemmatimonadetes bacterium]|nr:sigma-70 family RNA polymerase sigma factor [Gemmatimonadota bacterium]